MNVLIVHPCKGFYGGAEEVVVQLHQYLARQDRSSYSCVKTVLKDAPTDLKAILP